MIQRFLKDGLSRTLIEAISKHKNDETFKVSIIAMK